MRAARQASALNPASDPALSLWLMANLRRANRLPAGQRDLSYPRSLLQPQFYLRAAGPLRQHDVLDRALRDADPDLALNAIEALAATAGTDALVNRGGAIQPLLRALSYPDRRVRFAAAFALTNARPQYPFDGSFRVVPVLAEAVRQSDIRYALVIGRNQDSVNRLSSAMREQGYQTIGGLSLSDVGELVSAGPGVDMIVTDKVVSDVEALYHQTLTDYKLAAVPIIAVTTAGDQIEFNRVLYGIERLRSVLQTDEPQLLREAVAQASSHYVGRPIDRQEALAFATTALRLLREIAIGSGQQVYQVRDALPALLQALGDSREPVITQAAEVLALIASEGAQRAIADAALDTSRAERVRIALLGSLAESATHHGNHLSALQLDRVLALVRDSGGDLSLAAARAHGALTLPTDNVVGLILQQSQR
jgi:HEAT repeat protein